MLVFAIGGLLIFFFNSSLQGVTVMQHDAQVSCFPQGGGGLQLTHKVWFCFQQFYSHEMKVTFVTNNLQSLEGDTGRGIMLKVFSLSSFTQQVLWLDLLIL